MGSINANCCLQAVQEMHQEGKGHNDLKPENIMVQFQDSSLMVAGVKLIDLGSSSSFEGESCSVLLYLSTMIGSCVVALLLLQLHKAQHGPGNGTATCKYGHKQELSTQLAL